MILSAPWLSPAQKNSGFTLLEMSIVLAIIGLLVGGILAGQTFITNSRLNTLVGESRYYINAFNQFNNQYKAMPGDFSTASTWWPDFKNSTGANGGNGADNGDGNGLIRAGAVAPNNGNGELFGAFEHLALIGLIKGSYTGATTGAAGTSIATLGTNIPQSVMENVGYLFNHPDATDGNVSADAIYFDGKYGHVLMIAGSTPNALPNTGFLKPAQALQIDDKYDDGAPGKGAITTYKPSAATSATDCASSNVSTTAAYNVSLQTKPCYLIMNIPGS
jgi:prepilin-type N-terminal cleavage/methylation domain-containing protein